MRVLEEAIYSRDIPITQYCLEQLYGTVLVLKPELSESTITALRRLHDWAAQNDSHLEIAQAIHIFSEDYVTHMQDVVSEAAYHESHDIEVLVPEAASEYAL